MTMADMFTSTLKATMGRPTDERMRVLGSLLLEVEASIEHGRRGDVKVIFVHCKDGSIIGLQDILYQAIGLNALREALSEVEHH